MKWQLAKAIVNEFPTLKDRHSDHGCVSFRKIICVQYFFQFTLHIINCNILFYSKKKFIFQEHFFDMRTNKGFIENRFQNIRKNLTPSKKKYQTLKIKKAEAAKVAALSEAKVILSPEILKEKVKRLFSIVQIYFF